MAPHDRCDDRTDASHIPRIGEVSHQFGAVLASVCNGRYSRELNSRWQRPTRDERRDQEYVSSYGVDPKTTRKNLEADLSFHITSQHGHNLARQDNDHLHLTDSHFSQDDQRCDNSSKLSHDTGSFSLSNTISSVDLTTWGPDVGRTIDGLD